MNIVWSCLFQGTIWRICIYAQCICNWEMLWEGQEHIWQEEVQRKRLSRLKLDWWDSVFPSKRETNNQTQNKRVYAADDDDHRKTNMGSLATVKRTDLLKEYEWHRQVLRGGLPLTKAQETHRHSYRYVTEKTSHSLSMSSMSSFPSVSVS